MAVTSDQVAVADEAVALNTEGGNVVGGRLLVKNPGAETAWLGGVTVTDTTGYALETDASIDITLGWSEQLFAISSVAGTTLQVLRTGD